MWSGVEKGKGAEVEKWMCWRRRERREQGRGRKIGEGTKGGRVERRKESNIEERNLTEKQRNGREIEREGEEGKYQKREANK